MSEGSEALDGLVHLEQLPEEVGKRLGPYCEEMQKIHGDRLRSIIVYGSSTGVDFLPSKSDTNLLFVFNHITAETLRSSLPQIRAGFSKRIPAPLFLTRDDIISSLDVFPLEYLEMKWNHVLLYGEDLLGDLRIDREKLRLECEEQIRAKLIRLRQAYLEMAHRRRGVEILLKESLSSLIPLFRGVLYLQHGTDPPVKKEEVIKAMETVLERNAQVFLTVLHDREQDERIGEQDAQVFLGSYLSALEQLVQVIDRME